MRISDIVYHKIYSHTLHDSHSLIHIRIMAGVCVCVCLSIRSLPRCIHLVVPYLPAFVNDATKAVTITQNDVSKWWNRCILTIFIDAMSSIQFQMLMVWITTYFFFSFRFFFILLKTHSSIAPCHHQQQRGDSPFAFSLFYWIAL